MKIFNEFAHTDGVDHMSYEEYTTAFRNVEGEGVDEARINQGWEMCDQNRDGQINKREFKNCYWQYRHDRQMRMYWENYSEEGFINMANFAAGAMEHEPGMRME